MFSSAINLPGIAHSSCWCRCWSSNWLPLVWCWALAAACQHFQCTLLQAFHLWSWWFRSIVPWALVSNWHRRIVHRPLGFPCTAMHVATVPAGKQTGPMHTWQRSWRGQVSYSLDSTLNKTFLWRYFVAESERVRSIHWLTGSPHQQRQSFLSLSRRETSKQVKVKTKCSLKVVQNRNNLIESSERGQWLVHRVQTGITWIGPTARMRPLNPSTRLGQPELSGGSCLLITTLASWLCNQGPRS